MRRVPGRGLRAELVGAGVIFGLSLAYKLWVFTMGPVSMLSLLPWRFAPSPSSAPTAALAHRPLCGPGPAVD